MSQDIQQLVSEIAEATGSSAPSILAADAPVFQTRAMPALVGASIYFIGFIGGKDVGKSALINAIVGSPISESTGFGPGTETIVAYAHQSQKQQVEAQLERIAPGRFSIISHTIDRLSRQVLLDLPDIDSQYGDHVALTRAMLRHLLFPIWVQSAEKYADRQPQELLAAVASGNDPSNFIFALNKADQLAPQAVDELRADFAARIARTLKAPAPPRVFVLSARRPDQFDFPQLRQTLSQQKSEPEIEQSIALAGRQRSRSMLDWIDQQRLPERVQRIDRLARQSAELVQARLTGPLLAEALPRILEDPSHRAAMVDEVMDARAGRWPIVNMLNSLLLPLTALWRRNVGAAPTPSALVESALVIQGRSIADALVATFAALQQTSPTISTLYRTNRLWESAGANEAALELRDALVASLEQQRALAMQRIAKRGIIAPLLRWLLTLGAILWFPIIQPIGATMLNGSLAHTARSAAVLIFEIFSATYLLRSAAFLALWFIFLWMALRWDTQRRVRRLLSRWRALESRDGAANPPAAMIRWSEELLDPIHLAAERERALLRRAEEYRYGLEKPAA